MQVSDETRSVAGAMPMGSVAPVSATSLPRIPGRIASYRIVGLLGRGGMGVVYRAEQPHPQRVIALKVLPLGLLVDEHLLRRFEHEAEILGRLQHEGIAQIYEAGTADTGDGPQPFYAMELVQGKHLTDYADSQHLDLRQRLQLMLKICQAVQYAHQQGIIHRDLKPGNILVLENGTPKILDFGVARASHPELQALTMQTQVGQIVGTLSYMSPEQACGDVKALDNRSDVYSLGVILYELLTGRLPHKLNEMPLPQAIRMICEGEVPRLISIERTFRGDVETIVAKAMEKDRDRRFGSAAELAEDIRRYLEDEPLRARPASRWYRLRKFTRRNAALVGGTLAVFLVLGAGVTVATWQAFRLQAEQRKTLAERNRAEAQREIAVAGYDFFFTDVLGSTLDIDDTKTVLKVTKAEAEQFQGPEKVAAALWGTLGERYLSFETFEPAVYCLKRACDVRLNAPGENDQDKVRSMNRLALAYWRGNHPDDALSCYKRAYDRAHTSLGDNHIETFHSLAGMALSSDQRFDFEQSQVLCQQVLDLAKRQSSQSDEEMLPDITELGKMTTRQSIKVDAGDILCPLYSLLHFPHVVPEEIGRELLLKSAANIFDQVVAGRRRAMKDDDRDLIKAMHNSARVHLRLQDDQAIPMLLDALRLSETIPSNSLETATLSYDAGLTFFVQNDFGRAQPYLRRALKEYENRLGKTDPRTVRARTLLDETVKMLRTTGEQPATQPAP